MLNLIKAELEIIMERDPAARNKLEVFFCYPGLQAILSHRITHRLYNLGIPFIPRFISNLVRWFTGIEIHPGAKIGKGVFIDHGMGVVIGETAIVGDNSIIYQGVTLGGTGKETGKRHPTLGENVVVGAGAKILGNINIGDDVRIGAGSVVLRNIPSNCTVVGIPGRIVRHKGKPVNNGSQDSMPDPEAEVIRVLFDRIKLLEQELETLKTQALVSAGKYSEKPKHHLPSHFSSNSLIEEFLDGAGI